MNYLRWIIRNRNEKCQVAILRALKNFWIWKRTNKDKTSYQSIGKVEIIYYTEEINKQVYTFYGSVYSNIETDERNVDEFLSCNEKETFIKKKKLDEIRVALESMSKNESPGCNGSTIDFLGKKKFLQVYFPSYIKICLRNLWCRNQCN